MNDIGIPSDIQPANFGFRNNANTKITKENFRIFQDIVFVDKQEAELWQQIQMK